MTAKAIRYFLAVLGAVLAVFSGLLVLVMWHMSSGVFATDYFEREAWVANTINGDDSRCYRGGMANDIRDNVLSRKMSQEDVSALLGKPDGRVTAQEYQYVLGMCSGFGVDYDVLHVYFDAQGSFISAKIVQH